MKWKLLIAALAASSISANAYAIEITNGKLIGHKEWSSQDNIKFSFKQSAKKDDKIEKILGLLNKKLNPSDEYINTSNHVDYISGDIGDNMMTIYTDSNVSIVNGTNLTKNYTLTTVVCRVVLTNDSPGIDCATSENQVSLYAHGMINLSQTPTLILPITQNKDKNTEEYALISNSVYRDGTPIYSSVDSRVIE